MNNKVASGEFPDVIDLAGNAVSLAAIEQKLVLDLKPYIDSNKLEKNVGLNYKQKPKRWKNLYSSRTVIYNGLMVQQGYICKSRC